MFREALTNGSEGSYAIEKVHLMMWRWRKNKVADRMDVYKKDLTATVEILSLQCIPILYNKVYSKEYLIYQGIYKLRTTGLK